MKNEKIKKAQNMIFKKIPKKPFAILRSRSLSPLIQCQYVPLKYRQVGGIQKLVNCVIFPLLEPAKSK